MPSLATFKRRWVQFSLRRLLFATLVVAVGLGTLGPPMRRANEQRAVVAMVAKFGGAARYDFEDLRSWTGGPRHHPANNLWLRKLLGDDFFDRLVELEVGTPFYPYQSHTSAALDDDGFRLITSLTDLRILKVADSRLTDDGAKTISWLINLEELQLSSPLITGQTLEAVAHLPKLRRLTLRAPEITDSAVDKIGSMKHLQQVDLRETNVSRKGLNRLHQLLPKTWIAH